MERRDGHFNRTPHGGVCFLIHGDTPYQVVLLTTEIQAIAVRVNIGQLITVCNVYISGTHNFNYNIMNDLIEQLPRPFILLGDLNSHSTMWGCRNTDNRGRTLEKILTDKNLCLLNSGAPTRIGYGSESAIDVTLCTATLTPIMDWTVSTSPGDSDHCPIAIMK